MSQIQFYGEPLPGFAYEDLPGKLIALEGPDGVGRSTQIALLREWLEANGYAVSSSGLRRSQLAAKGIAQAKEGHTLGDLTMTLFYAADFADRLERDIIPALRAGFVVLTDRYIYSIIARARVRGLDDGWVRRLLGFAVVPDAVFYLRTDVAHLVPRVLASRGFDYWESGMDFMGYPDPYTSFTVYQGRMLQAFDELGAEFGFHSINASRPITDVFVDLRKGVNDVVAGLKQIGQQMSAES